MSYNTISLGDRGLRKELAAAAAITPGNLVEINSSGTLQKHSTAGDYAQSAFAVEDDLQGNTIDDDYSAGNRVQYEVYKNGDRVYAWLADGESASIGDLLVSNGDGTLKVASADSGDSAERPVAIAAEAVDMSDSSAADPSGRIVIEIL